MSQEEIFSIFEKHIPRKRKLFEILTHHGQSVANKAIEVAEKHPELLLDKTFLWESAWLHDIGIFLCQAPSIDCLGKMPYIAHGYLGSELLIQEGFIRHALVAERHTGTGLSLEMIREQKLPIPHRDMQPQTLEEEVICYADKFYSKTQLEKTKNTEHILKSLSKYGKSSVERFEEWHFRFK